MPDRRGTVQRSDRASRLLLIGITLLVGSSLAGILLDDVARAAAVLVLAGAAIACFVGSVSATRQAGQRRAGTPPRQ